MDRRQFLERSALGALSARAWGQEISGGKPIRVGVIGSGWYAKCDILRLIQIAPVEVVSICDVDKRMLAEAADIFAGRQKSGKKPRTYTDYREMLKEKDLDIVEIGTPDHWHALTGLAAMQAGADLYLQKPISVDVVEGQALLATARKLGRTVQVGTQRRSTPHLIEAMNRYIRGEKLGKIGLVEICCYYPMRSTATPPEEKPPEWLDWEMFTGPAPMVPYTAEIHPRRWRAYMEFGNGIVGDMCIHMLDMVRWMMGLGWPVSISSQGGILVSKGGRSNISDTQIAEFDFGDTKVVWTHRTYGHPVDPKYPWGATFYGTQGTLKASVFSYDFIPLKGEAVHKDVTYEFEQYPEDRTEKDLERHCAPAIRGHMKDLLEARATKRRPVADIEEGHISTASCILANMSMALGGRALRYDPAAGIVKGDPEATRLLARTYRKPWVHPDPKRV